MSVKKIIEVSAYNPNWPQMFKAEASLIKKTVGDNCIEIHHIGSTSVPGLSAKPIIDIIMVMGNPIDCVVHLESIGYKYRGEMNIPFRFYFSKKGEAPVHLHVYEAGNAEIELNLLFRNFLRSNSEALSGYAQLKNTLVQEQKNNEATHIFSHYTLGKHGFINSILQQAGFNKFRLMHCTHYAEWETAKIFRQKYFFDNVPISDPYTVTFNHPDHVHFVLYKGTEIIGYAHLQLWENQRSALRIIVIDEHLRGQKYGSQLLTICQNWLKQQGVKSVHVQTSPKICEFYKMHGYSEMLFNNPAACEISTQDIDLGKIL